VGVNSRAHAACHWTQVQEAVARCLPPLIPAVKEESGALVQELMSQVGSVAADCGHRGCAASTALLSRPKSITNTRIDNIILTIKQ
jgi:transposase